MDKERVIAKIRKLLALSESPNEHEAALAASKARQMMRDYQIGVLEVHGTAQAGAEMAIIKDARRIEYWESWLFSHLARRFDVFGFRSKSGLQAIGTELDMQLFAYAWDYLTKTIRSLYRSAWKSHKLAMPFPPGSRWQANRFRRAFCFGAAKRIIENLDAEWAKDQCAHSDSARALVVVKSNLIRQRVLAEGLRFKSVRTRSEGLNANFYRAGRCAADKVRLRPAMEGGDNGRRQSLR